jgi:hypothetical protein
MVTGSDRSSPEGVPLDARMRNRKLRNIQLFAKRVTKIQICSSEQTDQNKMFISIFWTW